MGVSRAVLVAILAVASTIVVLGCSELATTPETCEELAPRVKKLSEEQENPFSGRVLKFYDIEELEADGEYILKCEARATRSRGGDADVIFFMTEDEDGDRFIGMEPKP